MLRILQRYCPQSEDELFDILSLLDASLVSHQPTVMAATLSLFLSLCSGLPPVCVAALERARGPLLAACGSVSREMRFTALCHIQVSPCPHMHLHVCRFSRNQTTKIKKYKPFLVYHWLLVPFETRTRFLDDHDMNTV